MRLGSDPGYNVQYPNTGVGLRENNGLILNSEKHLINQIWWRNHTVFNFLFLFCQTLIKTTEEEGEGFELLKLKSSEKHSPLLFVCVDGETPAIKGKGEDGLNVAFLQTGDPHSDEKLFSHLARQVKRKQDDANL